MEGYLAALGREVGKVDTDSNGLARYSLKLQVPPGINHESAPELSLEYCQGTANGSLGVGWALGGISCIRKAPAHLAYDGFNTLPPDYDQFQPRLNLDGAELLNISGKYDTQDARYTTETEGVRRIITPLASGFLVSESTGRRAEYGTTDDSRVLISGQQKIREWRLKKSTDYHGNSVTYDYVTSPLANPSADVNTCYLSRIRYTSNERTGYQGIRIVRLDYSPRPDPVVQTVQGDKCTWASLLTAVRFGVMHGNENRIDYSYELAYSTSPDTGDSCLTMVTETSLDGNNKINLLPSTFGYTTPGVTQEELFKPNPPQVANLASTSDNVALFTMNISGRCQADIACVRQDQASKRLSIKAYLATRGTDGNVTWNESDGPVAELPSINIEKGFPTILSPDMNNDGRSDFVVPYADKDNNVCFSISQSIGTGFQAAKQKVTDIGWTEGSKFMAIDLSGQGTVDIVQIFTDRGKIAFRNFAALNQDGEIGLQDAVLTPTEYEDEGTIDWFQLTHAGTGAKSLVRIWALDIGRGQRQLKATTFALDRVESSKLQFRELTSSLLGEPVLKAKYSVLPCDINADGVQDIVLATAEYHSERMELTFTTYLGDGLGGFKQHGETLSVEPAAPAPLLETTHGNFHVTNLNGSNYPTLSFLYKEARTNAYASLSVDGRSDGLFKNPILHHIALDLPAGKAEILSTDMNGNGMGDWLFYTLEDDIPRISPVYNRAHTVGFLSWAQDPMGLRTTLKYGCLSDPTVYVSGMDWKQYKNAAKDSYPILAAPNYVVTQLEHRNDPAINSLDYNVLIKKVYGKARINILGRGWQGFEEIHTLNTSDNVLTTEKYLQSWPLTGVKSQIDTKSPDGQILKSIKSSYESSFITMGPWKVYRINKVLEKTDMVENGIVTRSNATRYQYDEHGNMTLQSSSETQRDQLMFQRWKRCSFMTIDGVTSVLTGAKVSSDEKNVNMSKFEPGDYSLTLYENDKSKAILKSIWEWSDDVGAFSIKKFAFNDYGKQVQVVDVAGLENSTTYDDVFHTFPVIVTEQGSGVSLTQLTAFDEASGLEVARQELNGLLTCYRVDPFGRVYETRSKAAGQEANAVSASDFLGQKPFVGPANFSTLLANTPLNPQRKISFERLKSPSGSALISAKVVTYSKEGVSGAHELVEYVDCIKQVRKRSSWDADDAEKIWLYWEYDSRGQALFESYPFRAPFPAGLDLLPARSSGIRSTFDTLGRPTIKVRPAHGDQGLFAVSLLTYIDGGARIQEKTLTSKDAESPLKNSIQVAVLERRYLHINQEDLIMENVDENSHRSEFQYDGLGQLIKATDAAGQVEHRSYNSNGLLLSVNNVYQNVAGATSDPAVRYTYNAARQLVSQVNAAHETINFQRDAKGRPLLKTGSDGRTVQWVYDAGGFENVASLTVFPKGTQNAFESRFEFTYDHRGRLKDRKLTLADGSSFTTSTSYNWQDQVVQKVSPDGAVLTHDYRGSEIVSSTLSSDAAFVWSVKAETLKYSAFGRPQKVAFRGSGTKEDFMHEWEYDAQGFPTSHSLSSGSQLLIKDNYSYNDLNQITTKKDSLTGVTTNYAYDGKRLKSSQVGSGVLNSYSYDAAGNLKDRRGTKLAYEPGRATGTKDGKVAFEVLYDGAGRVSQRVKDGSTMDFTYDSLGSLKSLKFSDLTSVELLADFEGEMLQRKHSNGSSDLFFDDHFSVHVQPDGSRRVCHKLRNASNADSSGQLLGTISNTYESINSKSPVDGSRDINVYFSDTKGNITHILNGEKPISHQKLEYDDFGLLDPGAAETRLRDDTLSTYEANFLDNATGLVNFHGRWYDPLVGRFTTPDSILNISSLVRTDGLNRYAFENNDPINNVDPTGHWSWSAILGTVISVGLIVAAVAVTVATGGAAAPLAAAVVGALAAGGVAGLTYSIDHKEEQNAGKFWAGFGTTVAINAAIGAATGFAGAFATPARVASASARILAKAAIGGTSSVFGKAAERGVDNIFYGKHHNLFEGAAKTFLTGALIGAAFGAAGGAGGKGGGDSPNKLLGINKFEGSFKLRTFTGIRQILEPKPTNPWADLTKQMLKTGAKGVLKPAGKIASWGAGELGLK